MSSLIRKLTSAEIPAYVNIVINAYPGLMHNSPEFKERFTRKLIHLQENEASIEFHGLFREGKLLGGMRIHSFKMNLFSNVIDVGGVGLVAVDLLHKKEKVAKELIQSFIHHFQEKGTSFVMLYPFRPDFYKKMGFGYGVKMNQYLLDPTSFPAVSSTDGLMYLDDSHIELIENCYNGYAKATHGMLLKTNYDLEGIFKNPDNKMIGYFNNGELEGYLHFAFQKSDTNFLNNNVVIKEFIYQNPTALSKISTFLNRQADQIQRIIYNTPDLSLEFLVSDARNETNHLIPSVYHETNTSGTGIMYKIINLNQFLNQLHGVNFNHVTCTFKLIVHDTFHSPNPITAYVEVRNGTLRVTDQNKVDFDVELDISDFSALIMGAIEATSLYQYGKLKITNIEAIETLNKMLATIKRPICLTGF